MLRAVLCCAHMSSKPSVVKRLGRCNDVVGATCILQGLILYCLEKGGALYRIVLLAARALLSPQQRAVGCLALRALQQQSGR